MKIITFVCTAILICSACPQLLFAQGDYSQCVSLASTLKQFNISKSSTGYLNSVFDNYCEQNGSAKSTNTNFSLGIVIDGLPVGFDLGSGDNVQRMQKFCRDYRETRIKYETQDFYEEKITDKALETVQSCFRFASQNFLVTHELPSFRQVTFFLKSSIDTQLELTGVAATPATGVSCKGQINGVLKDFDKSTNIKIPGGQPFACDRIPKVLADGTEIYDEQVISIQTKQGNYSVLLPREQKLPPNLASQIDDRLKKLDVSILGIQSQYNQIGTEESCYWTGNIIRTDAYGGKYAANGCKTGEYVRAIRFTHDFGDPAYYTEKVGMQCCPIKK